jgi:hypothetical protein
MRGCFSERGDGTETREEAYSLREPHTPKLEFPRSKVKEFKGVLYFSVCVGGFVGMEVLGCGMPRKLEAGSWTWDLGVRAAKTKIERVREFGVWGFGFFLFDFIY